MVHMPTCISGDAYQILDSKKNLYCAKFLSTRQIHVIENYGLKMHMYIFSTTFWNFKQMYFIPNPGVHYRFMLYLMLGSNTDLSHTGWVKIVSFKLQIDSCHSVKHFLADSHIWWLKQTTDLQQTVSSIRVLNSVIVKSARHSDSCYGNLGFRPQDTSLLYRFLCYSDLKIVAQVMWMTYPEHS